MKLPVQRRQPVRGITKGFRVTEAEACVLEQLAEDHDCDESVIIRYALSLLTSWEDLVRRRQISLDIKTRSDKPGGK